MKVGGFHLLRSSRTISGSKSCFSCKRNSNGLQPRSSPKLLFRSEQSYFQNVSDIKSIHWGSSLRIRSAESVRSFVSKRNARRIDEEGDEEETGPVGQEQE